VCHFLPRDIVHNRGLCRRAVSVCPSRSCISVETSKRSLKFFHRQIATPFNFFHAKRYGSILTGTPGAKRKMAIFDQYLAFASITAGSSSISCYQQTPRRHTSVNLVYDRKPRRYAKNNRTEFNCTRGFLLSASLYVSKRGAY